MEDAILNQKLEELKEEIKSVKKRKDWLNILMPFIGVLIGGLITSYTTFQVNKQSIKNANRQRMGFLYSEISHDLGSLWRKGMELYLDINSMAYHLKLMEDKKKEEEYIDLYNEDVESNNKAVEELYKLRMNVKKNLSEMSLYINYHIDDSITDMIYAYHFSPIDSMIDFPNDSILSKRFRSELEVRLEDDLRDRFNKGANFVLEELAFHIKEY